MLSFSWPLVFLLLPLPLLIMFAVAPKKRAQFSAIRVPFYQQLVADLGYQAPKFKINVIQAILVILAWVLLITAAARPTFYGAPVQLPNIGRDLMIAVDVSKSMEAKDLTIKGREVDRLEAVKYVLNQFIDRRESDRLGLILFGSEAHLQAPLTFDRETIRTFLEESRIGIAGPSTAIGDAIGLSVKRLQARPVTSRVLILLTDGTNTSGNLDPEQASELASKIDLKIYTIGVGSNKTVRQGFFGRRSASADLDETTLMAIAEQTGGRYFRAENTEELREIYQQLDQLEPIESDQEIVRPIKSVLHWPLAASLTLGLLVTLLRRL